MNSDLSKEEAGEIQRKQFLSEKIITNHRLGLISMYHRNYPAAIAYLSKAYEKEPGNRGIVKALGLSYVWNGQPDQALPLLKQIPEAR